MTTPNLCGAKDDKDKTCGDAQSECTRTVYQYADVSVPIQIMPNAQIGEITAEACGEPIIECRPCKYKAGVEITVTQRLSLNIPLTYRISACAGESLVSCRGRCDVSKSDKDAEK